MHRNDFSKVAISLGGFLAEPFHSKIHSVDISTNCVNILLDNSDYSKEELFELIQKHFGFLKIGFKQFNRVTESNDDGEEVYLHNQLIFFFKGE